MSQDFCTACNTYTDQYYNNSINAWFCQVCDTRGATYWD